MLPVNQPAGRWSRGGQSYAQYLSLSEDAAWAEFIRAAHVNTAKAAAGKRRHMWICQVHDFAIADLRSVGTLRECDVDPAVVVGPFEPCQEIGAELVEAGYRGVIAPCAALEGALSLSLFGPRDEHHLPPGEAFDTRYTDAEMIDVKLAKSATAPPVDLIPLTRPANADPNDYDRWPEVGAGLPARSVELDASLGG
jgi:hypothetical protein